MNRRDCIRYASAAVFAIACTSAAPWKEGTMADAEVTLFYLPFNYETYVPVTIESIEKEALCTMRVSSSAEEVLVLRRFLTEASKGQFDGKLVRLKAVGLSASPSFVDRDGGVLKQPGEEARLSTDSFSELKAVLDGLAKSHGCQL